MILLIFNIEISDELGRKIRMSPLGQKIFNEGIEEGKIEKQREIANIIKCSICKKDSKEQTK